MNTKFKLAAGAAIILAAACGQKPATTAADQASAPLATANEMRGEIRIVGSSTVYPFATKVAQELKSRTGQNVVVESTGSGGGHKLFCEGAGTKFPDITNSSRRQKKSEFDNCAANGVGDIVEVKIGFDGIVLANAIASPAFDLTPKQIYLALAKDIPTSDTDCTLMANPHSTWADIDPALPAETIEVYGPPPTSGTRDAFVEIAMDHGAKAIPCLADIKAADEKGFETIARTIREDGKWIDSGENDNAIVQSLVNTPSAIGVFGYSFLNQNADRVKAANVSGVAPTMENIATGVYEISRSLYFYLKKANVDAVSGLKDYAAEFMSDDAAGPGGYLEELGLIPLPDADRQQQQAVIENLTPYQP
jgi:phosphate transport system substrate-binding protein